jgi:hypothetical protein
MVFEEISSEVYSMTGGEIIGTVLIALGVVFVVLFVLAIYVYSALAWMTIARKLKYRRPWLAWIPIANIAMILQLGGFHWAWVFLVLVPVLGWIALFVLVVISNWRIYEKRNYYGWLSLAMILPKVGGILHLIVIGFVAWADKSGITRPRKKVRKKKSYK